MGGVVKGSVFDAAGCVEAGRAKKIPVPGAGVNLSEFIMKKSLVPALGVFALCFGTMASAFAAPKAAVKTPATTATKMAAKPAVKKKHKAKKVVAKKTVKMSTAPKMAPKTTTKK